VLWKSIRKPACEGLFHNKSSIRAANQPVFSIFLSVFIRAIRGLKMLYSLREWARDSSAVTLCHLFVGRYVNSSDFVWLVVCL
jgi:hypothetical protein